MQRISRQTGTSINDHPSIAHPEISLAHASQIVIYNIPLLCNILKTNPSFHSHYNHFPRTMLIRAHRRALNTSSIHSVWPVENAD